MDGAMSMEGRRGPEEGDISVCVYCGNVLEFKRGSDAVEDGHRHPQTGSLYLIPISEEKIAEIKTYPGEWENIEKHQQAVRTMNRRRF